MPETTYNPSITVDTGLYCPVCRGAIQANIRDSTIGPIVWDAFCDGVALTDNEHSAINDRFQAIPEFFEELTRNLSFEWARATWDGYWKTQEPERVGR